MPRTEYLVDRYVRNAAFDPVDADPQGTAINHVRSAEPALQCQTATELEQIDAAIENLASHHQIIVLDSPGKTAEAVTVISFLCDVAIIPLQPSTADVLASTPVLGLIKASQRSRGGKPQPWIVLNLTRKRDAVAKSYRAQHQDKSTIPIAKTEIRRLDDYRDAYGLATVATRQRVDPFGAGKDIRNLIGRNGLTETKNDHRKIRQSPLGCASPNGDSPGAQVPLLTFVHPL